MAKQNDVDILRLIHRCASWPLPHEIVGLVPAIFLRSPTTARDVDWNLGDRVVVTGLNHTRGLAANAAGALLQPPEYRPERLATLRQLIELIWNDTDQSIRVFAPQALLPILSEDPDFFDRGIREWLATANDGVLYAPNLGRVVWAAASSNIPIANDLVRRMIPAGEPMIRQRGGNLAALFAVKMVSIDTGDDPYCLRTALSDVQSRRGVAEFLAQLVDELPAGEVGSPGSWPVTASLELLYRLADDNDDEVCSQVMNVLRHTSAPLVQHSELIERLARSRAFMAHPASMLVVLSGRRDEMPDSVLDLCEAWASTWAETAGDISKREAADGYYVTDIVLSIYALAIPGGTVRGRCLDLTDRLIEHGVGSVEAKVEQAAYQTIVD